jgi:hypothetical protein
VTDLLKALLGNGSANTFQHTRGQPHSSLFVYVVCEAIGTAATPGLLCQPRVKVKMIVEKQMECSSLLGREVIMANEGVFYVVRAGSI